VNYCQLRMIPHDTSNKTAHTRTRARAHPYIITLGSNERIPVFLKLRNPVSGFVTKHYDSCQLRCFFTPSDVRSPRTGRLGPDAVGPPWTGRSLRLIRLTLEHYDSCQLNGTITEYSIPKKQAQQRGLYVFHQQ